MTRGVKGTGSKPSTESKPVQKVEQKQEIGEPFRCSRCRSSRNWKLVSPIAVEGPKNSITKAYLHQCLFCQRVIVTDSENIPRSNNPLDVI